jgi:hypothetical protein
MDFGTQRSSGLGGTWLTRLRDASGRVADRARAAAWPAMLTPGALSRAMGVDANGARGMVSMEGFETRILLEGSFGNPVDILLDVDGRGSSPGEINPLDPSTDNDYYRFTAPANDFVRILADTSNEGTASNLNTRISVYRDDQTLIGSGTNNGTLTSGLARDGWFGFVAEEGASYFIIVSSEGTAQGTYTLTIDALSTDFTVGGELPADVGIGRELDSPVPNLQTGMPPITPILGQLERRQQDIVYRYVAPTTDGYDSLVTVNAQSTQFNLNRRMDTRLEIYNAEGVLISSDSDAGRINDAFTTFKAEQGETYYIRVRSDQIRNANVELATGPFFLVFDALARQLNVNDVTRSLGIADAFVGFGAPTTPPVPQMPNPRFQTASYVFQAKGDGLTIITVQPTGLAPVTDPAVRLFSEDGLLIAFNDNFAGLSAQLEVQLQGGNNYYIVVDGFEISSQVQFTLTIASNHTFDPTQPIDDHPNNPAYPDSPVFNTVNRRIFEQATSLRFSDPFLTLDANQNPLRDRGHRATAVGTGRLHRAGDTDLFQFTAPVDMLTNYAGNNDDVGTSLFIGGIFTQADPGTPYPVNSRNLTIWDAADYWYTGAQYFDPNFNVTYGFNDNPTTIDTEGPEVHVLFDWNPGGGTGGTGGTTNRVLVVGGDFDLVVPGPFGPVTFRNLAVWRQNPTNGQWFWSNAVVANGFTVTLGSVDGPVYAATAFDPASYDPDGSGPLPEVPDIFGPGLAIGGDFTSVGGGIVNGNYVGGTAVGNVAFFAPEFGAWVPVGGGTDAPVFALTTYDFADPGSERPLQAEPFLPLVLDTPDYPVSLIIGGAFTGGVGFWTGQFAGPESQIRPLSIGAPNLPLPPGGINGTVFSLAVITDPDPDADGPDEAAEVLVIGGSFSVAGTVAGANNIVKYGRIDQENNDPALPGYAPRLKWEAMGDGTDGPVFAMTAWDPPDINNQTIDPILVIAGFFTDADGTAAGNIAAYGFLGDQDDPGTFFNPFGLGANGPIFALAVTVGGDLQEPSIEQDLRTGNPQEVLYLGGAFTEVQLDPLGPPIQAANVAQFSAFRGLFADFFDFAALNQGVGNAADTDPAPPVVFALAMFDDGDPFTWDRHDRRATRLSVTLSPTQGGFLNAWVRVYDSNLNLVYGFDRPGSDTISPPFPDPAGMIDGSLAAPTFNTQFEGIRLWGGEVYYIEVSAGPAGGGIGPYQLVISADAEPPDVTGDGRPNEINANYIEEPNELDFLNALRITTTLANGDGSNLVNTQDPPLHGNSLRITKVAPSVGSSIATAGDLGIISSLTDTDLYVFRAEFTGTAEIRLATFGILDAFAQQIGTDFASEQKQYNSRLDGALRIYNNDFQQIAYNDDTAAVFGDLFGDLVGTIEGTFRRVDPRVVINVIAGNQYFIQVESGQRYFDGAPANPEDRIDNILREIDFRQATGSYQLILNQMPQLIQDVENGVEIQDDWPNSSGGNDLLLAAPVLLDPSGLATISGVIDNTRFNPFDTDTFSILIPASGIVSVSVTPTQGSTLIPGLQLYKIDYTQDPVQLVLVGDGVPQEDGSVQVSDGGITADSYFIRVFGFDGSEGGYTVSVVTPPPVDDHANFPKIAHATDLRFLDFLGKGTATGNIESQGDSDLFRFSAIDYATLNLTVTPIDPTLRAAVTVFEVSEDLLGNPIFLRIAQSNGQTGEYSLAFSVNPNRVVEVPDPGEDRVYPYYYVLVEGAEPFTDFGRYEIEITFPPTDDHADADTNLDGNFDTGEYQFATQIVVDPTTGTGNDTGIIEVPLDSDLFFYVAPAGGEASVIVSRPTGSIMRARVTILDTNANILAQAVGADSLDFFQASVFFSVVRGQSYYIAVQGFEDTDNPNTVTTVTGDYTVSISTPAIDDYPNVGEFTLANTLGVIPINPTTGIGQIGGNEVGDGIVNPRIQPINDTDLFTFVTHTAGDFAVSVLPFVTGLGRIAPRVTLFDVNGVVLQTSSATAGGQERIINITDALAGIQYYVLVEARTGIFGATPQGEYRIQVAGPSLGGGGDPSVIDFSNPTVLPLNPRTGDVCFDDVIEVSNDRDLFRFTTAAAGRVYVQLTTPLGSLLDGSIRILNAPNENPGSTVVYNAEGLPGVNAYASFVATANTQYWVIVEGIAGATGSYTLCVNTQPAVHRLFFPEGFASDSIREFVSIINPNSVAANYSVVLRYETGDLETVIANGVVGANSRGGLTIIDGTGFQAPGIRKDTPYSIVIESDQPIGATLAHYDFGNSVGDSFTEQLSATWNFARVERSPGNALDFVTFYNPNPFSVDVTLTAYQNDGTPVSVTRTFGALRRGGWAINDVSELPLGVFSVVLTAQATNIGNQAAFEGIAASLSHYTMGGQAGYGLLGDPSGGSTVGVVSNMLEGPFAQSEAVFFNPTNLPATVTVTGSYMRANLPSFSRTFDIQAGGQVILRGSDFGLVADQPAGLRYVSNRPISVSSSIIQQGDADASAATGSAGLRFLFGDAFIDPALAGQKFFESIFLFNPTALNNTVTLNLNFTDGTSSSFNVTIGARGFAEVRLHDRDEIRNRSGPTWFSVDTFSSTPFTATMTHYDLLLGGGWATTGMPVGFINPISRIP